MILRVELVYYGLYALHYGYGDVLPLSRLYLVNVLHLEVIFIPTAHNCRIGDIGIVIAVSSRCLNIFSVVVFLVSIDCTESGEGNDAKAFEGVF